MLLTNCHYYFAGFTVKFLNVFLFHCISLSACPWLDLMSFIVILFFTVKVLKDDPQLHLYSYFYFAIGFLISISVSIFALIISVLIFSLSSWLLLSLLFLFLLLTSVYAFHVVSLGTRSMRCLTAPS